MPFRFQMLKLRVPGDRRNELSGRALSRIFDRAHDCGHHGMHALEPAYQSIHSAGFPIAASVARADAAPLGLKKIEHRYNTEVTLQKVGAADQVRILRFAPGVEVPTVAPPEGHAPAFGLNACRKAAQSEKCGFTSFAWAGPEKPAIFGNRS
jgi:hypothetical protein